MRYKQLIAGGHMDSYIFQEYLLELWYKQPILSLLDDSMFLGPYATIVFNDNYEQVDSICPNKIFNVFGYLMQ